MNSQIPENTSQMMFSNTRIPQPLSESVPGILPKRAEPRKVRRPVGEPGPRRRPGPRGRRGAMAIIHVTAEREVGAPAESVYHYLSDMREHHPNFLPPAFSDFAVETGGVGAGTI